MEEGRNPVPENSHIETAGEVDIVQQELGYWGEPTQLPSPPGMDQFPVKISDFLKRIEECGYHSKYTGDKQREGLPPRIFRGVLEGRDTTRAVAIKSVVITNGSYRNKLERVLRTVGSTWGKVHHPNILHFIGYKVVQGEPWFVFPWFQHGTLTTYIADNSEIANSDKVKLLCDAARGLRHLHSLVPPIVHGAIKPSNVLVMGNLEAGALCDWGLSPVFAALGRDVPMTNRSTGKLSRWEGLAGYLAKEVLEEEECGPPATAAADVFAFGGLILAAMSGKDPFWRKRNDAARIVAICMDQVPRPEEHPLLSPNDPLWSLVTECWSENSEARPSMELVLRQLERERDRRRIHENS